MSIEQLHNPLRWPPPPPLTFLSHLCILKMKTCFFYQGLSDCGLGYLKDSSNDSIICQCCKEVINCNSIHELVKAEVILCLSAMNSSSSHSSSNRYGENQGWTYRYIGTLILFLWRRVLKGKFGQNERGVNINTFDATSNSSFSQPDLDHF